MARNDIHSFIDRIQAGDTRLNRGWVRQAAKLLNEPHHTSDDDVWALLAAVDSRIPSLNITDLKILYAPVSRKFPAMRRFFIEAVARGKHTTLEIRLAKMVEAEPSEGSYRECGEILGKEKGPKSVEMMDEALAGNALRNAMLKNNSFVLDQIIDKGNWQDIKMQITGRYTAKEKQNYGWVAAWAVLCEPLNDDFDTHQLPVLDLLLSGGAQINVVGRRGTASHALEIICDRIEGCGRLTSEYKGFKRVLDALLDRGARWEKIWANPFAIEIIRAHPAFIRDELSKVANRSVEENRPGTHRPAM